MILDVMKRDGRKVPFDKNKIKLAVLKSFLDIDGEETTYAKEKARDIASLILFLSNGTFLPSLFITSNIITPIH